MQLFAGLALHALVGLHLRIFIVFHGYYFLGKTSGPTMKAANSEVLLKVVLCKVWSWCISKDNRVEHEHILHQVDQDFLTKKIFAFQIFISGSSDKTRFLKDKF